MFPLQLLALLVVLPWELFLAQEPVLLLTWQFKEQLIKKFPMEVCELNIQFRNSSLSRQLCRFLKTTDNHEGLGGGGGGGLGERTSAHVHDMPSGCRRHFKRVQLSYAY